jgi:hypothetical protein
MSVNTKTEAEAVVNPKVRRLCGDIPTALFTEFKIEAIRCGLTMAQAVEQAARLWLEQQKQETEQLIARATEEIRQVKKVAQEVTTKGERGG